MAAPAAPGAPGAPPAPVVTASASISVSVPLPRSAVSSPLPVRGQARVFEGNVRVAVVGPAGQVLGERSLTASVGAPQWGSFAGDVTFRPPEREEEGAVRFFSLSPRDGSIQDAVTIPVRLRPR